MKRVALLAAVAVVLGGCQPRGFGEQFMSSQEMAAKDEGVCASFGAAPGTQGYVDCRLRLRSNRSAEMRAKIMSDDF